MNKTDKRKPHRPPKGDLRHIVQRCLVASILVAVIGECLLIDAQKRITHPPQERTPTPREIADRTMSSTVYVEARDAEGKAIAFGSGFFVDLHYVITNFHVIEDARQIVVGPVTGKGHSGNAMLQYADAGRDLAVLECDCAHYDFPCLPLNISSAERRAGDKVYAVGNPKGLLGTFSEGIISGFRDIDGTRYLQITAPISPGSSGGPVVDETGKVIGVATAFIKDGQSLNLAISLSENLAYALYRIARVSKPRTLALVLTDAPATPTQVPAKSYSVQIAALVGQQSKFASQMRESTDLAQYYVRYNNAELDHANELQWSAATASNAVVAISGFLDIYQSISTAAERARIAPIIKDQLAHADEQLGFVVGGIDIVLKFARYPDTLRLGRKVRDETTRSQTLIRSIKID